jgi:serine protease Do
MRPFTSAIAPRAAVAGAALAGSLWVVGLAALGQEQDKGAGAGAGEAASLSASFRKAAARVRPSVVTVRVTGVARPIPPAPGPGPDPFAVIAPRAAPFPGEPGGSGVVVDAAKGLVLTTDRVVSAALHVDVVLPDGREVSVAQVRRDPRSDLALLVLDDPKGLTAAEWGDPGSLEPGDWVVALGRPDGQPPSLSAGVLSARGVFGEGFPTVELIQTDAATAPGGPLVDLDGRVIGIATEPQEPPALVPARAAARHPARRFGYAVPAVLAKRVAGDLARDGVVRRAFLGVAMGPVEPRAGERPAGVVVTEVSPDSPAAKAGLRPGDVILKARDRPIDGMPALQAAVESATIGEPLPLTILRDGKRLEVEARPGPRPASLTLPNVDWDGALPRPAVSERFPALGLRLHAAEPMAMQRFGFGDAPMGLIVDEVDPGGPAARAGIEPGMELLYAEGRLVRSLDDFRRVVAGWDPASDLTLRFRRGAGTDRRVIPGRKPGADGVGKDKDAKPSDGRRDLDGGARP